MTAASAYPPGSDQGSPESRAAEPSMEDILASIRRIIADDQQSTGSRAGGRRLQPANAATGAIDPVPSAAVADRNEVLDLAQFTPGHDDVVREDAGPHLTAVSHDGMGEPTMEPRAAHDTARGISIHPPELSAHVGSLEQFHGSDAYEGDEDRHDETLLASPMSESVMSAFEALAATVVLENKPMLEGILRDLLRPMLKAWLDDNLPGLVERLVRVEIERVARGGRG